MLKTQNSKSKIHNSELISARRRSWFSRCNQLGLSEEDQRSIADGLIPNQRRGKYNPDSEVSRKLIFSDNKIWNRANDYLRKTEGRRRQSHKRLDGTKSDKATARQRSYIFILARRLHWDEYGDDDLETRLERFSAKMTGSKSKNAVRNLGTLTAKEARNIILALRQMVRKNAA